MQFVYFIKVNLMLCILCKLVFSNVIMLLMSFQKHACLLNNDSGRLSSKKCREPFLSGGDACNSVYFMI